MGALNHRGGEVGDRLGHRERRRDGRGQGGGEGDTRKGGLMAEDKVVEKVTQGKEA